MRVAQLAHGRAVHEVHVPAHEGRKRLPRPREILIQKLSVIHHGASVLIPATRRQQAEADMQSIYFTTVRERPGSVLMKFSSIPRCQEFPTDRPRRAGNGR